jgi:transposase
MDQYVGLDVSLKQTWISVRQNRKRIWRGKCLSHPRVVAEAIRQHAPNAVLVVFERHRQVGGGVGCLNGASRL